ncbi:MAG: hypothetical protein HYU64_17625 [Armatimonadetes bacterium]|nr:hypothetical protein [Armatimonadota bacterium]
MNSIASGLPSLASAFRNTGSSLARVAKPESGNDGKETAKVVADIAVGAGVLGLTGLTILNSGAPGGTPQTNIPAMAFAGIGAGIIYFIDQSIEGSKAYKNADSTSAAFGQFAAAAIGLSGVTQALGWPPGLTVALATFAAAFMAGKALAHVRLDD